MKYKFKENMQLWKYKVSLNLTSFLWAPQRYVYFYALVGLVWSNYPGSYASSSIATGRASHARQVKGDDPDKK
jgi:hypothetical protein